MGYKTKDRSRKFLPDPGISPPSGQTSRFDDPSSAQPHTSVQVGIFASFGISYGLATLFLCFRYFQAIKISKKMELGLVIITSAYAIALFYFGSTTKRGWPSCACCTASTRRVATIGFAILTYTVVACAVAAGPCGSLDAAAVACVSDVALVHAVLNIASDLAVVAAPIPTVHSLGLSLCQRLSVGLILALGSAVVVYSIVRLQYVVRTRRGSGWAGQRQQYQAGLLEEDLTWAEAVLGLWSVVEVNLGILCACAMRLKPHARAYLPRLGLGVLFSAPPPPGDGGWPGGADLETIGGSRWHIGPGEQPQKAGRERSGGGRDPYLLYSIQDKDDSEPKESDVSITQSMRVVA
ncbi:hypothetical protein GGTG_09061 [Gaeumannomyces tritici R3-111a-1]|uniref:Rhodopsin domain-containing protein n=1 Tax=Gaeumannomyces tritici (strain R3-111a-1) TaxID=644352 RepID=J3P6C0_GAET3|nr:hypothetical protein GGTG_09061 [Gaeumannomyces tritici R3-111a-1]EJT72194.1 hypothetical protein GGTG_09061 [Gaeumannomyces tritici R3-111a-1]